SYNSNLQQIEDTLLKIVAETPLVLADPAPKVFFNSFDDSAVTLTLAAWCKKPDFLSMKNNLIKNVHQGLRDTGIQIPFPQLDVHFDKAQNTQNA
ncbi:MAG: mechanosensitive ion channel family protein, partial [Spirochaetaceae bacterium]|nr:mechanosensitive ion channel family protein [Spirochaetaceae bacterium]